MGDIILAGSISGSITVAPPAAAGSGTLTLPTGTDTLVGLAATQTLTNKSIVATQLTGTVAAARLPAGSVVQVVNLSTGALATGTTIIPHDDTIPQITEGNQYMSLAITPTSATNLLLIQVVCNTANSANDQMKTALFKDAVADALAVVNHYAAGVNNLTPSAFSHWMVAGTTSAITFTVRAGLSSAGTTSFNGSAGARMYGGVVASSITIMEIVA